METESEQINYAVVRMRQHRIYAVRLPMEKHDQPFGSLDRPASPKDLYCTLELLNCELGDLSDVGAGRAQKWRSSALDATNDRLRHDSRLPISQLLVPSSSAHVTCRLKSANQALIHG